MDELQNIQNLIYVIRGQRVMLDFDLCFSSPNKNGNYLQRVELCLLLKIIKTTHFQTITTCGHKLQPQDFLTNGEEIGDHLLAATYLDLRKQIESIRQEMNDILADQNDINESTRSKLDAISIALAELQSTKSQIATQKRRPIGFIQPKDEDKK